MNSKFDTIRPYHDHEVNAAIKTIMQEPMMQTVMQYIYPNVHSTQDFQGNVAYFGLQKVLKQSSDGLSSSGFEKLDKNTAYLFISNHRDIFLDTSLLNYILYEKGLILTASAIGDNLVKMPFLNTIAKINRNFLVLRGLSPREMLQSSKLMSEYIRELLFVENRSVWIAQREGRTKDGNDATNPGILKMLSMAAEKENLIDYFKKLRIVPVSISYEYDPTDSLKLPELLAKINNVPYVKHEKEDFNSILNGLLGQKKHIHFHAGDVIDTELDSLATIENANQLVKSLAQVIDKQIISNYKLWPSKYIAYDLLYNTDKYAAHYAQEDKEAFEKRMAKRVDAQMPQSKQCFLEMYANPVVNKRL
jgi:1-acyl-sn-glycerol-3-phosphate acyltransferase